MKRLIKNLAAVLLSATLLLPAIPAAATAEQSVLFPQKSLGETNFELLMTILDLYLEQSLYETDRETLIETMLLNYLKDNPLSLAALANSLLSANDPYSAYYLAQDGFLSATTKSFGVYLEQTDEGIFVVETLKDSNAKFVGILPGDRFVSVEGYNVEGLTLTGLQHLLSAMPLEDKNPDDSKIAGMFTSQTYDPEKYAQFSVLTWDTTKEVEMTFERTYDTGEKGLVTFSLPKGTSQGKYVTLSLYDEDKTAVIDIASFESEDVYDEFLSILDDAVASGSKNLIIDLRDNPGGYFEKALAIADLFVEGGKPMIYTRYRESTEPVPSMSTDIYYGDKFENYIVLVNENTASAAEVLANILDGYADASLIGTQTFGKAVGQDVYSVSNGDSFTITSFELLTKDMTSYNGVGLIPDVEIPLCEEKYIFPEELSHFNHANYVDIVPGAQNDAVLALEQRFGILGLLTDKAIDGVYDDATACATLIYQKVQLGNKNPSTLVTYDMVTSMTTIINSYKDRYFYTDTQLATALRYAQNKSQGKRLASEYIKAQEKLDKQREEEKEKNRQEYLAERQAELEAREAEE